MLTLPAKEENLLELLKESEEDPMDELEADIITDSTQWLREGRICSQRGELNLWQPRIFPEIINTANHQYF